MDDVVIRAQLLGKRYRIGGAVFEYGNLRETLTRVTRDVAARAVRRKQVAAPVTRDFWALRDVSFEVRRGEVLGLIGRNGAGKSTLLKLLARITEPSSGWADIRGQVGSLLEVGSGFHPELTGRENVYLNGAILGMGRAQIRRQFDEIVAFAEVEQFVDTPVKRYSTGMNLRLAFAVAAHLETSILIVDEVLAVGDMAFQEKCLGKMRDVGTTGRTVVFVSHNMGSIRALCSRALLLERGQIAASGPTEDVIGEYFQRQAPLVEGGEIPRDLPRQYGTGEAWIDSVRITDLDGNSISQLYLGQPFRVVMTFEAVTELAEAVIEIGVVTLDGTGVTTSTTLDGDGPPLRFTKGTHTVRLDLDVTLTPLRYTVLLAIHHFNGTTIEWVERSLEFTVLNVARDGADSYKWPPRGFVRPSVAWHTPSATIPS